jgi:hypothetical protein
MATRKQILEMLSAGEIDVNRATEMLNAVHESALEPPAPPEIPEIPAIPEPPEAPEPPEVLEHYPEKPKRKNGPRWLHIQVTDLQSGKNRVKVNVPLGLVHFGLKLGARFTDEVNRETMRDVMDALQDKELVGTLVEVEDEDDNERVHIYVD